MDPKICRGIYSDQATCRSSLVRMKFWQSIVDICVQCVGIFKQNMSYLQGVGQFWRLDSWAIPGLFKGDLTISHYCGSISHTFHIRDGFLYDYQTICSLEMIEFDNYAYVVLFLLQTTFQRLCLIVYRIECIYEAWPKRNETGLVSY